MTLRSLIKQNLIFFAGYVVLLISALFILIGFSKVGGQLALNPLHFKFLDYIFRGATILGDGIFILSLAIFLWFLRKKYISLMIIAGYVLSGIPVQIIKTFVEAPRPAIYLRGINYNYFVQGVTLHNYNSFPSGHTASAFALAFILSVYLKNKWYSLILLLFATCVGYSRIYLSQHFMMDVTVGSLIGLLSGITVCLFLDKPLRKISRKRNDHTALSENRETHGDK